MRGRWRRWRCQMIRQRASGLIRHLFPMMSRSFKLASETKTRSSGWTECSLSFKRGGQLPRNWETTEVALRWRWSRGVTIGKELWILSWSGARKVREYLVMVSRESRSGRIDDGRIGRSGKEMKAQGCVVVTGTSWGWKQDGELDRGGSGWEIGLGKRKMKIRDGRLSGGTIKMTFWHKFSSRQGDCQGIECCHGSWQGRG